MGLRLDPISRYIATLIKAVFFFIFFFFGNNVHHASAHTQAHAKCSTIRVNGSIPNPRRVP